MELKPCPFCGYGGDAEIMTWREPYRSNIVYAAQCLACGAIGEMCNTRELAAKNWNERAERSAEVVGIEGGYSGFDYCCSNCREALPECIEDAWDEYQADPAHVDKPVEYCPFCGARFVDEVAAQGESKRGGNARLFRRRTADTQPDWPGRTI